MASSYKLDFGFNKLVLEFSLMCDQSPVTRPNTTYMYISKDVLSHSLMGVVNMTRSY